MATDDGPLSRWARRKAASRKQAGLKQPLEEPGSAVPDLPAEGGKAVAAGDAAETGDPPAELPDIESLTAESDFTVFMRDGVPAELRRLALRKLWTSDPVLANLDGLVDYGEDYTDIKSGVFEAVVKALDSDQPDAAESAGTTTDRPEAETGPEAGTSAETATPAAAKSDPEESAAADDSGTVADRAAETGGGEPAKPPKGRA